jgi:uncharacterized membrane protein YbhN (UPF0104 family)
MAGARKSEAQHPATAAWFELPPRWLIALIACLVLEGAALAGLTWWAGWRDVLKALSTENAWWFGLCAGGQIVAYAGYTLALRGVACADDGVMLDLPVAFGVVGVGFSPIFSANAAGGFSIDLATLRAAGMRRPEALRRVLALCALEYAVLAPTVAVCGLLLFFHLFGTAAPDVALPWLAIVPGAIAAAWLISPRRAERFVYRAGEGPIRNAFAHAVGALGLLRAILADRSQHGIPFVGAALYWAGDMATLWGALRIFDVALTLPQLVLAYGTGWALTRRSLPLGGPGLVEVLLAWVLTWFDVPFANAAAGVIAYRFFNFWLALVPAAVTIPFAGRLRRRLVASAVKLDLKQ